MNRHAQKGEKLQLEVTIVNAKPQAHFCYEGQEYSTLNLEGDCENIVIGEWEESLCSWATLEVVSEAKKPVRVSLLGNGFIPKDKAMLEKVVHEANDAIRRKRNTTLDLTKQLYSLGWDIYLSAEGIPSRNSNL